MSVICQTFIQNSWKKDLCSNCFKTLADHRQSRDKNRYYLHTATPYHGHHYNNPTEWRYAFNDTNLRNRNWSVPKVSGVSKQERNHNDRSVAFLDQDPVVIGYGGDDYHSDDDELWDVLSDDGEFNLDKYDETDEDRAISKITKENTRFNTVIKEEIRSNLRYEPVYAERRVTRIDDSYNKALFNQNWKYNNDTGKSYTDFSKPYYLPRVSIGSQSSSASSSNSSYYSGKQNKTEVPPPPLKSSARLELPEDEVVSRSSSPDRRRQPSPVNDRCDSRLSARSDNANFLAAKLKSYPPKGVKVDENRNGNPSNSDREINNNSEDKHDGDELVPSVAVSNREKQVSDSIASEADCKNHADMNETHPTSHHKSEQLEEDVKSNDTEATAKVSVHYAVSNSSKEPLLENHYAVSPILDDPQRKSPNLPNRETKLAALAIELEQARHDQRNQLSSETIYSDDSSVRSTRPHKHATENDKQEDSQKNKKSKFSLKKLLKRNKDAENAESNPKAWKHSDYDKSTLRLKIIHPMDLAEALSNAFPTETEPANNDSSSQAIKADNEEKTPAHSCKQEIPSSSPPTSQPSNASNRSKTGNKSERPSRPPPPPKCNPIRPKSVEFLDLTVPLKNGLPMETSNRSHQEQVYDVPKNIKQQNAEEKRETSTSEYVKTTVNTPSTNGEPAKSKNGQAPDLPHNNWKHTNGIVEASKESPRVEKCIDNCKEPNKTPKAWITLEHSYAVVTAANHEVLSKFLDTAAEERSQQLWKPESGSLNWLDFELVSNQPVKVLQDKVFFNAIFRHGLRTEVTLMVTKKSLQPVPCGKGDSTYPVLGFFVDHFPPDIVLNGALVESPSTVHILQRSDVDTLENYCSSMSTDADLSTEKTFILLQLVHFLKVYQGRNLKGVPEMRNIFLSKKDKEMIKVVFLIHSDSSHTEESVSLCQFALSVAKSLFHFNTMDDISSSSIPSTHRKIFNNILRLLLQEKSFSLMQSQGFIEYALWGPINVVQNCKRNQQEIDITLQRWLDTERAKCLKLLVRTLCTPNVVTFLISYDEYHGEFLLKTSVRSLREVALKS